MIFVSFLMDMILNYQKGQDCLVDSFKELRLLGR